MAHRGLINSVLNKTLILCIVITAIFFIVSTLYFFYGSQESFPIDEQENKIKMSFGIIAVACLVLEFVLCLVYRCLTASRTLN